MQLTCTWASKMRFTAKAASHEVEMDAKTPICDDSALSPKQLLLAGVSGCTGMDVVALLKKYKQPLEALEIETDAPTSEGKHPVIFKSIHLTFKLKGELDPQKVTEAVKLSQTQYCGVTAMVSKSVPVTYTIELNGNLIGEGKADFSF